MPNREVKWPEDVVLLCVEPANRDLFAWLADHATPSGRKPDLTGAIRANEKKAKEICKQCPWDVKTACRDTYGRDYTMGVIAGMTDAERRSLYEPRRR